jgi:hypothetical protein
MSLFDRVGTMDGRAVRLVIGLKSVTMSKVTKAVPTFRVQLLELMGPGAIDRGAQEEAKVVASVR